MEGLSGWQHHPGVIVGNSRLPEVIPGVRELEQMRKKFWEEMKEDLVKRAIGWLCFFAAIGIGWLMLWWFILRPMAASFSM